MSPENFFSDCSYDDRFRELTDDFGLAVLHPDSHNPYLTHTDLWRNASVVFRTSAMQSTTEREAGVAQ